MDHWLKTIALKNLFYKGILCIYIYTYIGVRMYICGYTHLLLLYDGCSGYIYLLHFCGTLVLLPSTLLNEQWKTYTRFYKGKSAAPTAFYTTSYPCLSV